MLSAAILRYEGMQGRKEFTPQLFYELSLDKLALTYNLKKYLRFVMKKPNALAQKISLKQGKALAFLKLRIHGLKNYLLSPSNFEICRLTKKTNLA